MRLISNIKKTLNYLKKNGIKSTYYAVKERAAQLKSDTYTYIPPSDEALKHQREISKDKICTFSIIVPVYNPNPEHFKAMIESVINQSYPHFELILAITGANKDEITSVINGFNDDRIKCHHLAENKGISANTNVAIYLATGDYVGLLDHDDLLTPDALYEMAQKINKATEQNINPAFLYCDEDKFNGKKYFEYHSKPKLNLDLILSNNYIGHFLVMRRELIQHLKLRPEYDGAQDYDLCLRAISVLLDEVDNQNSEIKSSFANPSALIHAKKSVLHIDKVLYHWRTHPDSTAENPGSKVYAYEAGKRTIEDFLKKRGLNAKVHHTRHLGFYRVEYLTDIFEQRPEVGVVGGKVIWKNKITAGIYLADGTNVYEGLHKEYSGYMHRASLMQEAEAVDIRAVKISKPVIDIFNDVVFQDYQENKENGRYDWKSGFQVDDYLRKISVLFCEEVRAAGYTIIWDPQMIEKVKSVRNKTNVNLTRELVRRALW